MSEYTVVGYFGGADTLDYSGLSGISRVWRFGAYPVLVLAFPTGEVPYARVGLVLWVL
jgi:hypothetical protein